MKTLLVSEIFPPQHGGSGRWFWEVYTRLSNSDTAFAVGKPAGYEKFDESHSLNIARIDLSSTSWGVTDKTGILFYIRTYLKLCSIVKSEKVEQIHCGRCIPEGFIASLINLTHGIPYIAYVHGEDVETAALSRELKWIAQRALNKAALLICNSKNTANILLQKWNIPENKIKVIYPGVDTGRFIPASNAEAAANRPHSWNNRQVILTVGRLQKRKGHDKMIAALVEIKKCFPDVLYVIIGNGEEKAFLESEVKRLDLHNNVSFLNEISDTEMVACYQHCDLFILPNRSVGSDIEGFGMVLVEAQACAKPVIAGDSGGTAETMIQDETGFIIDCTDESIISKKIITLLSNPEQLRSMGTSAYSHAHNKFSWEKIATDSQNIFNTINKR